MLRAGSDIVRTDMVRVITLQTADDSLGHLCIYIYILSATLPEARPHRVAAYVHGRRKTPRHIRRTAFVCCDLSHSLAQFAVEGGGKIDLLREKHTTEDERGAMDMVKTIQTWYARLIYDDVVDLLHECRHLLRRSSHAHRRIQHRAYLVLAKKSLRLRGETAVLIHKNSRRDLGHLTDLLLNGHGPQMPLDL